MSPSQNPRSQLDSQILFREWIAIALVGGLVILLAIVSWLPQLNLENEVAGYRVERAKQPTIEIVLEGAVSHPGSYTFAPGVTVREVLKATSLLKEANRKEIPFRKVLLTSQTLVIPHKEANIKKAKSRKILSEMAPSP